MYETEVARGIALLDEKLSGWRTRIDLDRLSISRAYLSQDGCGCILAQLYGTYFRGIVELGLGDIGEREHGFDTAPWRYVDLEAAWRRALGGGAS